MSAAILSRSRPKPHSSASARQLRGAEDAGLAVVVRLLKVESLVSLRIVDMKTSSSDPYGDLAIMRVVGGTARIGMNS